MRVFSHVHSTPRILLFPFAVLIQLAASALVAIGFVLNNAAFLIGGSVVWLIWFAVLFMIAVPATDQLWQNHMRWLKPAALTIFVMLLILGLGEAMFFQTSGFGKESSQLLTSFEHVFVYNDATALNQQAAENLIDGNNPYAKTNIVTALKKFNGAYDKTTPLREGRFAEVFPYPEPEELQHIWQEALKNPEHVPPEIESNLSYPAIILCLA